MQRVRRSGLAKRDRLRTLLNKMFQGEPRNGLWEVASWRTVSRRLNPLRYLASKDNADLHDVELFVTRLEERRVLNGDFGMLAGIADIADLQASLDLYAEDVYGGDSFSITTNTDGHHDANLNTFPLPENDLHIAWNEGDLTDVNLRHDSSNSFDKRVDMYDLIKPSSLDASRSSGLQLPSILQAEGEGVNMAPAFTSDPFAFSLAENSDVGTLVGTVTATDVNSPILMYSITDGDPGGVFSIDSSTGNISVVDKSAIDFETNPNFSLTVRVNDNHSMLPLSDTSTVNVSLLDLQTSLQITDASDVENSAVLTFAVDATGDNINQAFDVQYQTTDGTAVDALSGLGTDDYQGTASSVVSFLGNSTNETHSITVALNNDAIVEPDESMLVNLLSTTSNDVVISFASATGTIQNDDVTTITISDVVKAEGDSGTRDFVFFIRSSAPATQDITLTANTVDASAVAGSDYTAITNQLVTIAAGANSAILTVRVDGDTNVEMTETFSVVLSDPTFGGTADPTRVIIGNSATGAILDDDLANRATLSVNDVSMDEGDLGTTSFVFTIESDIIAQEDISVTVNTSNLFDAFGGVDYTALTNHVAVISKGSTSTTVTVDVTPESTVELDETFAVTLSNPLFDGVSNSNAVILGDEMGIGTITNDDAAAISISDVSLVEGDSGAANLVFVLSSDAIGSRDMDVRVNTADLVDAIGGTDYAEILAQTAVISAGSMSTTVTVAVIGDTVVETNETLSVLLTSAVQRFSRSGTGLDRR